MLAAVKEPKTENAVAAPGKSVLVVDDSPIDRRLAGKIIESSDGLNVLFATDGRHALELLERQAPAVVLTDLQMPELDGLELVKEVRKHYPSIPVVLMTAYGSEEIAMLALEAGAASYVPKRALARDLVRTLQQVISVAAMERTRQRLLRSLEIHESLFRLENDPGLLGPLIDLFMQYLAGMEIGDATTRMRIGVALQESLANALFHGNLEVSSDLRQDDERQFHDLAEERRTLDPFQVRRIEVRSTFDRCGARFVIRDEGPGFDIATVDRPIDPDDLTRIGGRGLLLIRAFMDEVSYNAIGNEITLVKRQKFSS